MTLQAFGDCASDTSARIVVRVETWRAPEPFEIFANDHPTKEFEVEIVLQSVVNAMVKTLAQTGGNPLTSS
jgi:hypothetical protein